MGQYPEKILHRDEEAAMLYEKPVLNSRIIATMRKRRKYLSLWLVITGGKKVRRWIKLMEMSLVKYVSLEFD